MWVAPAGLFRQNITSRPDLTGSCRNRSGLAHTGWFPAAGREAGVRGVPRLLPAGPRQAAVDGQRAGGATRVAMLERGEADLMYFVPGELIDRVKNNIGRVFVAGKRRKEHPAPRAHRLSRADCLVIRAGARAVTETCWRSVGVPQRAGDSIFRRRGPAQIRRDFFRRQRRIDAIRSTPTAAAARRSPLAAHKSTAS